MSTNTELLPCPFCGGEPEIIRTSVHCNSPLCEAQPFTAGQSKSEAIAAWNRRSPSIQAAPAAAAPTDERAAFEKRMHADGWRDFNGRWEGGFWYYDNHDLCARWIGWNRRAALSAAPAAGEAEQKQTCRDESECSQMPWCRIQKKCLSHLAAPQSVRTSRNLGENAPLDGGEG